MTGATESAVVVTVPIAEPVVGPFRARYDWSAGWGVPAHVTVLYPFVPPPDIGPDTLAILADAVRTVHVFAAEWRTTGWFGEDVLWLAPEPEASFRALTIAVSTAFPAFPPYGGMYDDVVPHLTVGDNASHTELLAAERDLLPMLPIAMGVTAVQVMCGTNQPDSWHTVAELPLG
jgi:2'-5' RNA ligase